MTTAGSRLREHARRAATWKALLALALAVAGASAQPERASAGGAEQPNLLFILSDDQRRDTMEVMPATVRNLPVNFRNTVATTPLCCPSRSSFLTGRYAHNTGVLTNFHYPSFHVHEADSLGPWLQANGYYTGFVGKYFNRYTVADPVPPGWDEFYANVWNASGIRIGNGHSSFALRERYLDGPVQRDEVVSYPNGAYPQAYITTVVSDLAVRFVDRANDPQYNPDGKPWALFVWPNAPNAGAPEPRYATAPLPRWNRAPSFLERNMRDKPREIRNSRKRRDRRAYHVIVRAKQLRQLMSVDEMVGRLFSTLDDRGLRDRTWALYASDNGRLWGEHRLSNKLFAYEESIRVPLRMWIPGSRRTRIAEIAANIDVAPTLMALAGDSSRRAFDGRSLLPLLDESLRRWRPAVLIENWAHVRLTGVRTKRWKYVRYPRSGRQELYHLGRDPYELENSWRDYPRRLRRLRARLEILLDR